MTKKKADSKKIVKVLELNNSTHELEINDTKNSKKAENEINKNGSAKQKDSNEKTDQNHDNLTQNEIEEKFYYALNHEIRRNLLKIIGKNGESSFTQFKKNLKTSTGTLYHHLEVLKELISQNDSRKYILTPLGKHALNFLIKNYDSIESNNIEQQRQISKPLKGFITLVPKSLIEKISNNSLISWSLTITFLSIFFILIIIGNINSSFIFFLPISSDQNQITPLFKIFLGFKFIIAVVLAALVSEILCRYLFHKSENTKKFLSIYSFGLFPMIIYLVIYNLFVVFNPPLVDSILSKIIMILFQIWTIWLISYILIVFKFIKLERSLLITFLIHYAAFNVLLFTMI